MKTISKKSLKKFQKDLQKEVIFLNAGGCGEFAYLMGKKLKREGIPFKLKLFVKELNEVELKKEALEDIRNNRRSFHDTAFPHCYVEVGDLRFDGYYEGSNLFSKYAHLREVGGEYTLTDMYLALKNGGWNPTYSENNKPDRLKRFIDENFNLLLTQGCK